MLAESGVPGALESPVGALPRRSDAALPNEPLRLSELGIAIAVYRATEPYPELPQARRGTQRGPPSALLHLGGKCGDHKAYMAFFWDNTPEKTAQPETEALIASERAAQAAAKAESRFRELLEAAPDGILEVDRNGSIVLCNAATEKIDRKSTRLNSSHLGIS